MGRQKRAIRPEGVETTAVGRIRPHVKFGTAPRGESRFGAAKAEFGRQRLRVKIIRDGKGAGGIRLAEERARDAVGSAQIQGQQAGIRYRLVNKHARSDHVAVELLLPQAFAVLIGYDTVDVQPAPQTRTDGDIGVRRQEIAQFGVPKKPRENHPQCRVRSRIVVLVEPIVPERIRLFFAPEGKTHL